MFSSQHIADSFAIRNESSSTSSSTSRSTSISHTQATNFASHVNQFRSISLVDSIEFKFNGNINKNGIVLGDCDNDEKNELVVGTMNGELLIFKGNVTTPCASIKELGMISCVLIGDILNNGFNNIICLSIEGFLNIFSLQNEQNADIHSSSLNQNSSRRSSNFSTSAPISGVKLPPTISDNEVYSASVKLNIVHSQQVQANAMCALITDIDNDGQNEFIVALTDRVVRSYRSIQIGDEIKLIGLHKWEFSDQIGSITLSTSWEKCCFGEDKDRMEAKKNILVAQHGGVFAKISCYENLISNKNNTDSNEEEEEDPIIKMKPEYCNITMTSMRNPQISSEILSDFVTKKNNPENEKEEENLISIATNDGILMVLNEKTVKWQCQLEQQILSLKRLDIDQDGNDELILCTWNGLVYIVRLDCVNDYTVNNIVTCQFGQPVGAFTVGQYDLTSDRKVSCLVFATFTNSIHLYYNVDCSVAIDTSESFLLDNIRKNSTLLGQLEKLVTRINNSSESTDKPVEIDDTLIKTLLYEIAL